MRKRDILLIGAAVFVLGAGLLVWQLTRPKPNVQFVFSPTVAAAKLDNQSTTSNGKHYILPGDHTVSVSFDGFAPKEVRFTAKTSGIQTVTVVLIPDSPAGYTWLKNHPAEATARETIGSAQFYDQSQQQAKANPIIALLPYIGPGNTYRIDYGKPPTSTEGDNVQSGDIGIYITYYTPDGIQEALGWIKDQGYNPDLLHIIYTDKTSEYTPTNNPNTN